MTAAATLTDLQWQQRQHDIAYHSDIWQLPPQRSLTHMTLHQTKYMGGLVAALHANDVHTVRKLVTDAFVITLATANILNQDLSEQVTVDARKVGDLGGLGCVLSRTGATGCDIMDAASITRHYAALCASMAKACEAFDHAEDYPSRKVLAGCNADICRMVIGIAAARNIDLPAAYQARMAQVEAKAVFNQRIEKTRSDKPPAKDNAAPASSTRGTIHQHR